MKKKLNSCLLLGTMLFCLSTLLTSCDLIFDEEDNPVSDPVIPPLSAVPIGSSELFFSYLCLIR